MDTAENKIKFIYDSNGNRTDVLIPLDPYAQQLEDFFDIQVASEQKDDEKISFEEIEKRFKENNG